MKASEVPEQVGTILVSFAIYEIVYADWKPTVAWIPGGAEFTWLRAILVIVFCTLIIATMVVPKIVAKYVVGDTKKTDFDTIGGTVSNNLNTLLLIAIILGILVVSETVVAYLINGSRIAFLLFVGFQFFYAGEFSRLLSVMGELTKIEDDKIELRRKLPEV